MTLMGKILIWVFISVVSLFFVKQVQMLKKIFIHVMFIFFKFSKSTDISCQSYIRPICVGTYRRDQYLHQFLFVYTENLLIICTITGHPVPLQFSVLEVIIPILSLTIRVKPWTRLFLTNGVLLTNPLRTKQQLFRFCNHLLPR